MSFKYAQVSFNPALRWPLVFTRLKHTNARKQGVNYVHVNIYGKFIYATNFLTEIYNFDLKIKCIKSYKSVIFLQL